MSDEDARAFLGRAPIVHLAANRPGHGPLLRALHGVLLGDLLAFHGSLKGEKGQAIGEEAACSAEEMIAEIPSHFSGGDLACSATSFYRSALATGRLVELTGRDEKAQVLQALMEKHQPEGDHVPIDAGEPRYERSIEGVQIFGLRIEQISGKAKLGQNRSPETLAKLLCRLWERGRPEDLRAIDTLLAANPATPTPAFLHSPAGARLLCAPGEGSLDEAAALLAGQYWTRDDPADRIKDTHRRSSAWVCACEEESGRLIATARGVGDGFKQGWLYDIIVAESWRGRGLGEALTRLLLDHPLFRRSRRVWLATRDSQPFYERLGFADLGATPPQPGPFGHMLLSRED